MSDETVTSAAFLSDGTTYAIERSRRSWRVNVMTPKAWAGTGQTFRITFAAGSIADARFSFR